MTIPVALREAARAYREAAADESTLALKFYLARHALALAQLAERIERGLAGASGAPCSDGL